MVDTKFKKGSVPWNKGKGIKNTLISCITCGKKFKTRSSKNIYCSKSCSVKLRNLGKHVTLQSRIKMSLAKTGETEFIKFRHTERDRIMNSKEYKLWRMRCILRDNFCCRICLSNEHLEIHHVHSFAKFPELRFEISNGVTLCSKCHKEIDEDRNRFK